MFDERNETGMIVDGHAHLYDCYRPNEFLDSASSNLDRAAKRLCRANRVLHVLMLVQGARDSGFERLAGLATDSQTRDRNDIDEGATRQWLVRRSESDSATLIATQDSVRTLIIISGRQIVTRERLEVLALGTVQKIEDGNTLDDTLQRVTDAGATAVLPWGVGKWLGSRGQIIRRLIEAGDQVNVHLGDTSARPVFWPRSSLFRLAAERGIRVLPGTDPLPLPTEQSRVGTCGFFVPGEVSPDAAASAFKRRVNDRSTQILEYVTREPALRFIANQARIRWHEGKS